MYITNARMFWGDPEHLDILVISWQFEHFLANNWQGINNSHQIYTIMMAQWTWKKKSFDFHHMTKTIHWL